MTDNPSNPDNSADTPPAARFTLDDARRAVRNNPTDDGPGDTTLDAILRRLLDGRGELVTYSAFGSAL